MRKLSFALLELNKIVDRYKGSSPDYKEAMEHRLKKAEENVYEALKDIFAKMRSEMQIPDNKEYIKSVVDEVVKSKKK